MRIISTLVILLAILVMITPKSALAAETSGTDETNINPQTQSNPLLAGQLAYSTPYLDQNSEGYKPAEVSPEEAAREAVLAKYQAKLAKANLPDGQFTINASAYTASADECGNDKGITASGLKVKENRTLACPPQFPFGAKVSIDGMGVYVCEDRGGAIKGNHFDIYMQTKKEAFAFGRRNLLATVVN